MNQMNTILESSKQYSETIMNDICSIFNDHNIPYEINKNQTEIIASSSEDTIESMIEDKLDYPSIIKSVLLEVSGKNKKNMTYIRLKYDYEKEK